MNKLDPYSIPLESINLIEASAGTGKSWTVTYLYLRLILEKNLSVDQILVVTFTDAATKELRDDIRQRITGALIAFESANSDETNDKDDEYQKLINNSSNHDEAIRKLNRAKLSMDEAAVFTIHGFCRRSLKENAFEAALPFESELMADDSELMQKLTDDFWRRYTKALAQPLLFKLQQQSITPDLLLKDIKNVVGKPYLEICGPESEEIKAEQWVNLKQCFAAIIKQWEKDGDTVAGILLEDKNLNRKSFGAAITQRAITAMASLKSLNSIDTNLMVLLQKFKKSYVEEKVKKNCTPPEHSFFTAWDEFSNLWEELNKSSDGFLNNIRIALIEYLQIELPKEKQRLGILSFDDLLLQLQQALQNQPTLANQLRDKYQAALIDEFQDTDPIQYDIFHTIYPDSTSKDNAVFFVGDPKQAIYSFRGGDIYTYLSAKSDTQSQNQFTLEKNWRSHESLINAFNTLYAISDNPFKDEGIDYIQVDSGDRSTDVLKTPNPKSALNFWQFDFAEEVKQSTGAIRKTIANSIAGDIAQLLNDGVAGAAKIGDKPISGGDIAILVRSHTQADIIKTALNARGIPSVQNSRDSIFETHEANEFIHVLKAIITPQQEEVVRRAMVTDFMGYQGSDLINFQNDSNAWEEILLAMQDWHQQWKRQGFLPMIRSLMESQNTHLKLLSYANGERRISNVLQLSELIHQSARNNMLGMSETLRWLQKQQLSSNNNETELRLESDQDLVKIVTIHKSKGLEYPIVYCPYIGMSANANTGKIFTFNKEGKARLEIGSSAFDEHKELKQIEESAEDTRLLYVALTRAKYQCIVVCFTQAIFKSPDRSALGWLLSNGKTVTEDKTDYYLNYNNNLQKLAESKASINLELLPEYPASLMFHNKKTEQQFMAREFKATIKQQAQITSFSGLTAGAHDESPDYDSIADNKLLLLATTEDQFPRGATAGTALHEIFEHIDFVEPVTNQIDVVKTILDKYGFDEKHHPSAIQLIQQSLDANLAINNPQLKQSGFSLKQLTKAKRLDEMEFYLPLSPLRIDDLKQLLFQHLPQENTHWQLLRDAVDALYFEQVEGFLKGFIDIIFEYDGRYYLADYKSNSLNDYDEDGLFEAMADSHYYLQYLFYSVALHRYLKQRIANYRWETHIGGAYYLFIRGMTAETATVASANGVFFNKPSLALIEALDKLFVKMEGVANG